jgi:hypothetical protein
MQLKFKYNTQEEIPEEYKAFYVERDGAWFVDVQGATDARQAEQREAELSAERNALQGECDALTAKLTELQRVNQGAGAAGSAEDASARYNNPFRRETFNLTRQGEIWRKDPRRARALQEAAK